MNSIEQLAEALKHSPGIVYTGAGVSTNSGIPDFRSKEGFYQKYHEDDLSIDAFFRNIDEFYIAFQEKFSSVFQAKPNDTHLILANLEKKGYINGIITQNVDRLHQSAGSKNVFEFHGNIFEYDLIEILNKDQHLFKTIECNVPVEHLRTEDQLQYKITMKKVYKPNVVLYGEGIKYFRESIQLSLKHQVHIIMGTSFTVSPFNMLSYENKSPNLKVFVINNKPIDYYSVNNAEVIQIIGDTSEILKELNSYLDL
ncbi:MAG: hypothetical protein JXR88_13320 [Clostridia bacterium]|nr:hypothetical protein [Clostridia bacterium]